MKPALKAAALQQAAAAHVTAGVCGIHILTTCNAAVTREGKLGQFPAPATVIIVGFPVGFRFFHKGGGN